MMSSPTPIGVEQNDGVATLSLRFAGPHRFDLACVRSLSGIIRRLSNDPHVKIIWLRTEGQSGFSDGYSLNVAHHSLTETDRIAFALAGQQLATMLKSISLITVAEIKGPCHGPGWELALACDYRFAIATPQTTFGFPDTRFGLFPCWGGISELVAKLGPAGAKRLLSGDETLTAREAERCGLVNFTCCERRAKIERRTIIDRLLAKPRKAKPPGFLRIRRNSKAIQRIVAEVPFHFNRPLESLIRAAQSSRPEGLAAERICFAKAVVSVPVVATFSLQKTADAKPAYSTSTINPIPPLPHVIGIVGADLDIIPLATNAVLAGSRMLVDPEFGCENAVLDEIRHAVQRGMLTRLEAEQVCGRVHSIREIEELSQAGLIFAPSLSLEMLDRLESIIPPRCLLAVIEANLKTLQDRAVRPGRIVGLCPPVSTIPSNLFELSSGPETTADAHGTMATWIRQLGGRTVRSSDRSNHMIRRVLYAYWDEAIRLVSEGVSVQALDSAVRSNGTRIGPFEQLDEMGFDTIAGRVKRLIPLTAAGMQGRGTGNGHGFYRYKHGIRTREYHPACSILWDARAIAGECPLDPLASIDMQPPEKALTFAGERITLRIVNEAMNCLHDDRLATPAEIDFAIAMGADLLPFAGGPIRFADRRGISNIATKMADFAARIGPRFSPSPRLLRQAAMGVDFYSSNEQATILPFALRAA